MHSTRKSPPLPLSLSLFSPHTTDDDDLQLLRDLKTTPISLLCYAHPKTKNILTQRQKDASISGQGEPYEKQEDLYRNMYEVFGMQFDMGLEWVDKVEAVQAGEGPDSSDQGGGGGFSADGESSLSLLLFFFLSPALAHLSLSPSRNPTLHFETKQPTRPSSSPSKRSTPLPESGRPVGRGTSTSSLTVRVRVIGRGGRRRGIGSRRREWG